MIVKKTSVLGALIVAVRKGKRIKEVTSLNISEMTVRDVTGKVHQVDYFVAIKPPTYIRPRLQQLGIEGTRDVKSFIKRKERSQRRESLLQESDESAAA